jgi:hypothetical protein
MYGLTPTHNRQNCIFYILIITLLAKITEREDKEFWSEC